MILDTVSWACLVIGGFLCVTGAVGIFRFPDFFSRMHAASVTDSLGSGLIIMGLILQTSEWLVISKLLFIVFFIFLTSPTSSHALAKAALHSGLRPWKKPTTNLDSESS